MKKPLTCDFNELVRENMKRDPEFRQAMLLETVNCFLQGDIEKGNSLFRNYIVDDMGYKALGKKTGIHEKSLNRMFGPKGNPTTKNLLKVINAITVYEGIKLKVVAEKA